MKGFASLFVILLGVFVAGCDDKTNSTGSNLPLYRSHFIGMGKVVQGTNASKLKEVWALPASHQVRKEALDKIATAPFQLWRKSLPSGARDQSALIRPLLDDLLSSESFIELKGASAKYDAVLAIEL